MNTTTDAILRTSPVYRAAISHPHRSGSAFQVMPKPGLRLRLPSEGHRLAIYFGATVALILIGAGL